MQVYGSSPDLATQLRNLTNEAGRLREGITYDYGKVSCDWWTRGHVTTRSAAAAARGRGARPSRGLPPRPA